MQRPQLIKLRDAIRAGKIHRVWVWRVDRLGRSGIVDTLAAVQECRRSGCEVLSVADGFALDGPHSEIVLAVLAWAAQMERAKIRENQNAARARMQLEGRPWGRPPLSDDVRARVMSLKRSKKSLAQIARELHISKTSAWNVLHETDQ